MKEINYDINCGKETIRLVLQFPDEEQDTVLIQKEIKAILITELQEQIKNFTQGVTANEESADVIKSEFQSTIRY